MGSKILRAGKNTSNYSAGNIPWRREGELGEGEENKVSIQRYKGLGEMNPNQLWDTTMNPETRIIKQVTIEDAARADIVFDMLMGDDVSKRKHFIQTHAKEVSNLDI